MEWISVNKIEQLPEFGVTVLVYVPLSDGKGYIEQDRLESVIQTKDGYSASFETHLASHWMPLPEPPKP